MFRMQIEQIKIYIEKPLCAIEIKIKCFYVFLSLCKKIQRPIKI
jgi:hypothetical protein